MSVPEQEFATDESVLMEHGTMIIPFMGNVPLERGLDRSSLAWMKDASDSTS
jgi:hypothetical protein